MTLNFFPEILFAVFLVIHKDADRRASRQFFLYFYIQTQQARISLNHCSPGHRGCFSFMGPSSLSIKCGPFLLWLPRFPHRLQEWVFSEASGVQFSGTTCWINTSKGALQTQESISKENGQYKSTYLWISQEIVVCNTQMVRIKCSA